MLALLEKTGIDASRSFQSDDESYAISVASSSMADAIVTLERSGFPRSRYKSIGEVFAADGFVTTPFEERARYVYALNEELAQSISNIVGVYNARVHVVLPETDPLSADETRARASVFVYHSAGFNVSSATLKIKTAVANSIDNLSPEDVVVMPFVAEDEPFLARR